MINWKIDWKIDLETDRGAIGLVGRERIRQVAEEGRVPSQDVGRSHELAAAAGCYLLFTDAYPNPGEPPPQWPWDAEWWKPQDWERDWVRGGALALAAIDAGRAG